jgi:2-oxoglutarate dehydrogenase E1 component
VVPSTPASYFHALRRQLRRDFRKPVILFNSKRLLRFKPAFSYLADIQEGTRFSPVIEETEASELVAKDQAKKLILCSGQFYYDLVERRHSLHLKDVHIVRLEQLSPFPY